jgi:hypothetical protein
VKKLLTEKPNNLHSSTNIARLNKESELRLARCIASMTEMRNAFLGGKTDKKEF